MIKRVLTAIGMFMSPVGFSQIVAGPQENTQDQVLTPEMQVEIQESCGHLLPDGEDFNQCVQIVTMDFTVYPHNANGGSTCPGSCNQSN